MLIKRTICSVADLFGAFHVGHYLARRRGPFVRAVNYHATPAQHAANLERQLAFLRRHFDDCGPSELDALLSGAGAGASLLLSFDDGYRSNYDIAAPLLERYGFTGWFFISSGRIREPGGALTVDGERQDAFMSFDELRDLSARGHVIGCHGHSHRRLAHRLGPEEMRTEVVESGERLRAAIDAPVADFCWIGGEEWSYSALAHRAIVDAGYRHAFMTNCSVVRPGSDPLRIDRVNIEADWSLPQVRFYLSGLMDIAYAAKRQRVARLLKGSVADPV